MVDVMEKEIQKIESDIEYFKKVIAILQDK